ncbi:hypothetical protein AF71_00060550 [Rhizobium sp. 57MFTsu3.2]|nr:hypothetical protein [Rhizobium sp. 57MFTsu3.2]
MAFNSHNFPLGEQAYKSSSNTTTPALLSSIRTMTVGSGISPDLLTLRFREGARGLRVASIPPVGNYTPP